MADQSLTMRKDTSAKPKRRRKSNLGTFIGDLYQRPNIQYATFSFVLDAIDPLAYLDMCWDNNSFQYYWEEPSEEFAIAAGGSLLNITAEGPTRFNQINSQRNTIQEKVAEYTSVPHPHAGMMWLGGFSFFNEVKSELWKGFEAASFTIPKWLILKDGKFNLATLSVDLDQFPSPEKLHQYLIDEFKSICNILDLKSDSKKTSGVPICSSTTILPQNGHSGYKEWSNSVAEAKELINRDVFKKIVLARNISVPANQSTAPTQIINNLRRQYTNCYNFMIHQPNGHAFLGSTPERLGAFRSHLLLTDALAGSMQRGQTATEDSILEKNLSDSSKNLDEHNFVIRDIEERLAPFVDQLDRKPQPEVKKLSNVQHLYTPIRAQLKKETHMFEVLSHLHPTPAVGGYPWPKAKQFLHDLEHFDRGWYAGPIGWINTKGSSEFAVAIRSGLVTESKTHFFAGCGIVANSDPDIEWEETNLKLKPMLSALQYD